MKHVPLDTPLGTPGGGRYDGEAAAVLQVLRARAVLLLVIDGARGDGLSCAVSDPRVLALVPEMLEDIARNVRKAQAAGQHP